jgi:hypothetical protein
MRIYIIGNDGITLCHKAPAPLNDGEIAVASNECRGGWRRYSLSCNATPPT